MNQDTTKKSICDACRKETPREDIRYLQLRTCCSVQRIPLCRECYDRSTGKKTSDSKQGA